MNKQEFASWKKFTETSKDRWVIDPIHNGQGDQELLVFKGGQDGAYAIITQTGTVLMGSYTGAIPHIGEAMFVPTGKVQCKDFNDATARFFAALGAENLRQMFAA